MQAAIYARINHDPRGESLGVTRQLDDCRALAEEAGWTIVEVYRDNDVSAMSGAPRPEYRRMLGDIRAGRIGGVVVWHPDRLYRRIADLEELIPIIEDNGVAIRTVKAGDFDLATGTGQMIARILGAVAMNEGRAKSDRWKRSWRQRRELGRVTPAGWRTFGYTIDGKIRDDEAERLRQVVADVLGGKALRAICDDLNAEGLTTTRGGKWANTGLRVLLRNPRIAGYTTYGYSETYTGTDGKEHKRRLTEIVGDGDWEPVVNREDWHLLQALLAARSTTASPRRWLLSGMLTCGACGAALHSRPGRGYQTYRCLKAEGGCGKVDAKADRVDEIVEAYARQRLSDDRVRLRLAELRSGGNAHLLAELDALQSRLAEIEEQMADPGRSVTALIRAGDKLRDRIDTLQAQLVVKAPIDLPVGDEWPTDLGRRRKLIGIVAAEIHVDPASQRGGAFRPERVRIVPA